MSQTGTKVNDDPVTSCQNGTKEIIRKRYSIQQYKTPKIRSENSRAGLSYTVASIGFVTTKPERLKPKGALAPVTPNT